MKICGKIVGEKQKSLNEIFECQAVRKASEIEKDAEHILSQYFELLPSGRRLRSLRFSKTRTNLSFIPKSIVLLNQRMNKRR